MSERWFVCPQRRPHAPMQLFCLPYAGAGASAYREWPAAFGDAAEVQCVQLPGRENRLREAATVDPDDVATAIADRADRPFAIFGHSLGGRLGFEAVRALRRVGGPQPRRLYPSSCRPPHVAAADGPLDGVADAQESVLVDRLVAGGGIPAEVLAEPDLMELLLPTLRADLRWLDGYRYREQPPLSVPITVFAGADDAVVPPDLMHGWARHSTEPFAMHVLPGGHFFLHEQLPQLARLIEHDLLATDSGGRL